MRALLTGGAGFIGSHVLDLLLAEGGWQVVAVDNFDLFYDPAVKRRNLAVHIGDERLLRSFCELFDVGFGSPVQLDTLVTALACAPDRKVDIAYAGEQADDAPLTHSSIDKNRRLLGYQPRVSSLGEGLAHFMDWFPDIKLSALPLAKQ